MRDSFCRPLAGTGLTARYRSHRLEAVVCHSGGKNGNDIWVLPLEGNRKPAPLLATEFSEAEAVFSPDMQWIAYPSNESGRYEVYVRPFVAAGGSGAPSLGEGKWQISKDGGFLPRWIADGRQIVFETVGNGALMAVDVKAKGARFEAGVPVQLFPAAAVAWRLHVGRYRRWEAFSVGCAAGSADRPCTHHREAELAGAVEEELT